MRRKCYTFTLILLVSFSLLTIIPDQQRKSNNNLSNSRYDKRTRNASEIDENRDTCAVSYINGDTQEKFQQQPLMISDSLKIDTSLRNYSLLCKKGYLQDGELRIIVSPLRKKEMHPLEPLTTAEIFALSFNVQKFNATIVNTCKQLPFITLKLPYESIFELSRQNFIAYISIDTKYHVYLNESVSIIKSPETWHQMEMSYGHEINGSGMKIAVLDTGIDKIHLDLNDLDDDLETNDPKVIAEKCFTDENCTTDGHGHGTHCAAVAAGTGQASNYTYVGVAPAAQLLNGKVLTDEGWGYDSWIINGIEWAVTEGANVISMSFGSSENTDGTDPVSVAVNWATDQGSICVIAAGNEGSNGMFSIGTPGCASSAITVGASDKADRLASFSSLGYTADFRMKPDVLAPGVDVVSCRAHGTDMGTPVNDEYTKASGTSMATPHISGLCALISQIHPNWNQQTVKYSILNGAVDLGYHTYEQGSGRANVCSSLSMPLVVSSPISFKRIRLFEAYSQNVTLRNVNGTSVNALLNAHIGTMDGIELDFISINKKNVSLDVNQMVTIQVTIIFSDWTEGFFEGNLTVTSDPDVIRIPLATAVFSSLNLICQDEEGQKVKDVKWQLYDSISHEQLEDTWGSSPTFFVKHGMYTIVTYSMIIYVGNEVDYEGSFLLYKNVTVPMGSDVSTNISLDFGKKIEIQLFSPIKCYAKMIKDYGYYGVERILQHPYIYLSNMCSLVHLQKPVFSFYGPPAQNDWMDKWNMPEKLLPYSFDTYFCRWNLEQIMTDIPDQLVLTQIDFAEYMIEISNCNKFPDHHTYVWFNDFTDRFGTGLWIGFITFPGAHWRCYVQPIEGTDNLPFSHWGFALSPELHDYSYFILRKPMEDEKKNFKVGYVPSLPQQLVEDDDQIILQCPLRGSENTQYVETEGHYRLEIFKNSNLIGNQSIEWQREVYFSNYMKTHGSGRYDYRVSAKTSQNISQENLIEYQILYDSSEPLSEQDILPPTIDCINCSAFQVGKMQEFTLRVNDNSGVKNVSVWFKPDNGSWNEVFLENKGGGVYFINMIVTDPNIHSVSLRINVMDVNGNTISYETAPCIMNGIETTLHIQHPDQCEANDSITVHGNLTTSNGKLHTPVYLSVFLNEEKYVVLTNYLVETEEFNGEFVFIFIALQDTCINVVFQGFYLYPSISDEGHVSVLLHDIAILNITSTFTHVYQGDFINITIIVQNQGNFVESFNVILYANSSIIENTTIVDLSPGGQISLTCTWDTKNVTLGTYVLQGYVTTVAGEDDISDNTYIDSTIEVVIFNVDFNDDGVVNTLDLRIAAIHFEQVGSCPYDLNFDNVVDFNDFQIIVVNFGKHT